MARRGARGVEARAIQPQSAYPAAAHESRGSAQGLAKGGVFGSVRLDGQPTHAVAERQAGPLGSTEVCESRPECLRGQ